MAFSSSFFLRAIIGQGGGKVKQAGYYALKARRYSVDIRR